MCMQLVPNSDEAKIGYNDSREMFNLEQIIGDPAMRTVFDEMQSDPQALQKYWYLVYSVMIGSLETVRTVVTI